MALSLEEEVDGYYASKETYTEHLQKAADGLPQDDRPPGNHASAAEPEDCESWFFEEKDDTAVLSQLTKDLDVLIKKMKIAEKQSEEPESNVKPKGKKK